MSYYDDENDKKLEIARREADAAENRKFFAILCVVGGLIIIAVILGLMFGLPQYSVWRAEMDGRAQLSEAEYSKQVQIQEAQSNLEAEKLNAESEVERAKGAAEARQAEGLGMTAEQYIQYLWVKKLSLADSKIIYLPTEGGIPTLTQEADK